MNGISAIQRDEQFMAATIKQIGGNAVNLSPLTTLKRTEISIIFTTGAIKNRL